jgi:L-rhamnose mutarotase
MGVFVMSKRYMMINELKPEHVDEYVKAHETMHEGKWQEQLDVLHKAGAKECIAYIYGNLSILLYECDDIQKSFSALGEDPRRAAWEKYTQPMFAGQPKFDGSGDIPHIKKIFDMTQQLDGGLNDF